MTTVDLLDRTHSLVAVGGAIYAARQSGLYRISGGVAQSLYEAWLPEQDVPTLAIAVLPDGTLLGGINGGAARSEDDGRTWEAIQFRSPPPLVTCLADATSLAGESCILAGTYEDGVFRSTDGGKNWRANNHGLYDHGVYCLALSPAFANDGIVYAGTGSGTYISENAGRLWQDLLLPADDETVLSLALSPGFAADGTLYVGTESHGLLRSLDAGDSWETALETEVAVNSLATTKGNTVVAQVDDAVLRSADRGATWTKLVAENVDCLALDSSGETLLIGMADGSIRQESP